MNKKVGGATIPSFEKRSWPVSEAYDLKYLTTVAFALLILKKKQFVSVTYGQIKAFFLLNNDTTSFF